VRKRRPDSRPVFARAAGACGSLVVRLCAIATRRPVDFLASLAAAAACLIIVINAVFLQSGPHPAPFFANSRPLSVTENNLPRAAEPIAPPRPAAATVVPQPIAARHNDPIAELIGPSPRIAAIQRALAAYGYGQIKPSGVLDDATSSAIETFERGHKLPVTGQISGRLVSDLAAMVGHPLE
jgi:hypothetical protein